MYSFGSHRTLLSCRCGYPNNMVLYGYEKALLFLRLLADSKLSIYTHPEKIKHGFGLVFGHT